MIKVGLLGTFNERFLERVEYLDIIPKVEEITISPTRYYLYALIFENKGINKRNVSI